MAIKGILTKDRGIENIAHKLSPSSSLGVGQSCFSTASYSLPL